MKTALRMFLLGGLVAFSFLSGERFGKREARPWNNCSYIDLKLPDGIDYSTWFASDDKVTSFCLTSYRTSGVQVDLLCEIPGKSFTIAPHDYEPSATYWWDQQVLDKPAAPDKEGGKQ